MFPYSTEVMEVRMILDHFEDDDQTALGNYLESEDTLAAIDRIADYMAVEYPKAVVPAGLPAIRNAVEVASHPCASYSGDEMTTQGRTRFRAFAPLT